MKIKSNIKAGPSGWDHDLIRRPPLTVSSGG